MTKMVQMKKICCIISCKYRRFRNPKILYNSEETLVLSVACSKDNKRCSNKNEKLFKKD